MLAIIGGTGLYHIQGLETIETLQIDTPFGSPSAPIVKAAYQNTKMLFLPRHGKNHERLPHEINYPANIFALKKLGATRIISVSATGSLQEDIHPGDIVFPSQYFDWTRGRRQSSFFGSGLSAHISTAEPVCTRLNRWMADHAEEMELTFHFGKTYACVEGPRLGTKAESHFLRLAGCDLVGMTNVPEAFLAKEAQICYAAICIVTDYDCWKEDPSHHASLASVLALYSQSIESVQDLLRLLMVSEPPPADCSCRTSLKDAVITPDAQVPASFKDMLTILRK
ncbi:MAG: MTAP family purine nucleoside phosphorylase [Desulfotignum balticum]|jgi:5'-methylthioadenosine phosphorylase|uniref:Purine nucleoside phosphorylase n=1 Tax=Desulfotignum balticum TaxID=115781 RepID=A0A931G890_9BACT|nr:MTAP family purine nucleoside phosphorylase [Desulfotignum balticum]